jgi:O-antigen/teichoic acid export membrane protein
VARDIAAGQPGGAEPVINFARTTLIVSITRLMNRGLIILSPIILVRLLTVQDYGRYREFLMYATVLAGIGTFGINGSLLRFVPSKPEHGWYFVNQSIAMTAAVSFLLSVGVLALNAVTDGWLIPEYGPLVVLYTFLFVNFDFWEYLWIAERRPLLIWRYSTGRLLARLLLATAAAAVTRNVDIIVWSLVGLETVRIIWSMLAWRERDRQSPIHGFGPGGWRERLAYSMPFGTATILITVNRQLGNLFVVKLMGPVALAHYAIGTYIQPITNVLRNSLSDVLLGEMSKSEREAQQDGLRLFRRTTVVTFILLMPCAVLLARFADTIVVTLFSEAYRSAVPVFQLYTLALLRDAIDLGVPLRAINLTGPIMRGNFVALVVNGLLLLALLPLMGLTGAVVAYLISRVFEGWYLAAQIMRAYETGWRQIANWWDLLKVVGAALVAAAVLYGSFWTEVLGVFGVIVASILYSVAFLCLLWQLRVPEANMVINRVHGYSRSLLARLQP